MPGADVGAGAGRRLFPLSRWKSRRELDRWLKGHRARLVRLAWAWSGDPVLADDLVQETWSRAIRAAASLRDADRVDTWMIRIMHRVYLDHLKSSARRERPVASETFDRSREVGAFTIAGDGGPETVAIANQRSEIVRHAIASLPSAQRQVVTLVDLEELSYAECAKVLAVPVGTVMSRLNRARATLRTRLAEGPGARLRRVK